MDETLRYIPEPPQVQLLPSPKWWHRLRRPGALILGLVPALVVLFIYSLFILPPKDFPVDSVHEVAKGETLSFIADRMESAHIVRSAFLLKALVRAFSPKIGALAGTYEFDEPENAIVTAWRLAHGRYNLELERITIPEGLNSVEIAAVFLRDGKFSAFNAEEFTRKAAAYEGKLFPDTYLFLPTATADQVIKAMISNYDKRIATLNQEIKLFGKPVEEVITMASIIEREARTVETRRIIAGILWKRLVEGMPLQVDAAFTFVNGKKDSKLITLDDLKIDSPYNTYLYKGLPPGPIGNPGLAAIKDTVHPEESPYYFYLSDSEGNMHYAVSHAEHVTNKDKYLR